MEKYSVQPYQPGDELDMLGKLRKADADELHASHFMRPDDALLYSLRLPGRHWSGKIEGVTATIFGITETGWLSTTGVPWLLGTDALDSAGLPLARISRYYVKNVMMEGFERLENYVDARHEKSKTWLKWCGFTLEPAEPYGYFKMPFHRFWKE